MTDAVDQTMSQFTEVLIITVAIAMVMALLIAYNAAAINAEERTRETATMFAYGIGPAQRDRGKHVRGAAHRHACDDRRRRRRLRDPALDHRRVHAQTMPDLGILISISAVTYALAALAGIVSVSLAPLLTLRRLKRTDVPSALRVVE